MSVSRTLDQRGPESRLGRIRAHFAAEILLAKFRGDFLWRDACIASRDLVETLQLGKENGMLKDPEEKQKRGYIEKKSVVWMDGREKLVLRDWRRRKWEIFQRSDGRCERIMENGKRCERRITFQNFHPHHIKHRWPSRTDEASNLEAVCFQHHEESHVGRNPWPEKRKRGQQVNRVELSF